MTFLLGTKNKKQFVSLNQKIRVKISLLRNWKMKFVSLFFPEKKNSSISKIKNLELLFNFIIRH